MSIAGRMFAILMPVSRLPHARERDVPSFENTFIFMTVCLSAYKNINNTKAFWVES
jgi:hypothetical protein